MPVRRRRTQRSAPPRVAAGRFERVWLQGRPSVLRSDERRRHAGEVAADEHLDVELRARDLVQREAGRLVGGAQALGEERSRCSAESQTVMARSRPSRTRRQPCGGTGPEPRTCAVIRSCCSSVRSGSSMMLQMAMRASLGWLRRHRKLATGPGHQRDCGFATEPLLNVLTRPRGQLRAVAQGLGERVADVALDRSD